MEKSTLKTVLSNLSNGETITVNYLTNQASLSGEYTVVGTKKGRGKGGSMIAELSRPDSENVVVSTKDSDNILNVIVNGTLHGYENEAEIPPVFEKDAGNSVVLKSKFRGIAASLKTDDVSVVRVAVVAPQCPEIDGTHNIVEGRQLRGRSGQIILKSDTGVEIWSYRHSGVINQIDVVDA